MDARSNDLVVDRLAPTKRPNESPSGFQRWRNLLFLHWAVPTDILRELVPRELSLDLYEDKAYIGLVPFEMEGVRPSWCPELLAFRFLETNVRTYVHYQGRPGVYFFSLDAASRPAVWAARNGWGLPYHFASMKVRHAGDEVEYDTVRPSGSGKLSIQYRIGEELGPSEPDTLEHFLLERYLLFVRRRQRIDVGQVYHTPYPARRAEVVRYEEDLMRANQLPAADGPPAFVHFSPGVDVELFSLRPAGKT